MISICNDLFLGDANDGCDEENLKINEIQAIVRIGDFEKRLANIEYHDIRADDDPEQDLLLSFPAATEFINNQLVQNHKVLVHCVAGVSRSVTIIIAYMVKFNGLNPNEALVLIRKSSLSACPNEGFMRQLEIFHELKGDLTREGQLLKIYKLSLLQKNWIKHKQIETSSFSNSGQVLKCRKCRALVANMSNLVEHEKGSGQAAFDYHKRSDSLVICNSYFTSPLDWMKDSLQVGVEGKLSCFKCNAKLGSFNWYGLQCSCGCWVAPAFSIQKKQGNTEIAVICYTCTTVTLEFQMDFEEGDCFDLALFKKTLKNLRKIDDNINSRINSNDLLKSCTEAVQQAATASQHRKQLISYCSLIVETDLNRRTKLLEQDPLNNQLKQSLKVQETLLQHIKSESTVESIITTTTLNALKSRCPLKTSFINKYLLE